MTIRTMLDTNTPAALTPRADLLATYADLATPTLKAALEQHWPQVVWIDRGQGDPMHLATVYDVEPGALTPQQAIDKAKASKLPYLTAYASRSTMMQVDALGWGGYRWYATLDGTAHVPGHTPGLEPAAIQCLGEAQLGFHADLSLVFEDGWHPQPQPSSGAWVGGALSLAEQLAKTLQAHL